MKYCITIPQAARNNINQLYGIDKIIYECSEKDNGTLIVETHYDLDSNVFSKKSKYSIIRPHTKKVDTIYNGSVKIIQFNTFEEAKYNKAKLLQDLVERVQNEIKVLEEKMDKIQYKDLSESLGDIINMYPEFKI